MVGQYLENLSQVIGMQAMSPVVGTEPGYMLILGML